MFSPSTLFPQRTVQSALRRRVVAPFDRVMGMIMVVLITLCACGAPRPTSSEQVHPVNYEGLTSYPLSVKNCGLTQVFTHAPQRVVIMNGTSVAEVESLIELGLSASITANAQGRQDSIIPGMRDKIARLPNGGVALTMGSEYTSAQLLSFKPDLIISTWPGVFTGPNARFNRQDFARKHIPTMVTPLNCGFDDDHRNNGDTPLKLADSLEYLLQLGEIFDIPQAARRYVDSLRQQLADLHKRVVSWAQKSLPPVPSRPKGMLGLSSRLPKVLVVSPAMSSMNANGLPAVLTGGIYDAVVRAAGGEPVFEHGSHETTATINAETLAVAHVDYVVVATLTPEENGQEEGEKILHTFSRWNASTHHHLITIPLDGVYYGPASVYGAKYLAEKMYAHD